MPTWIDGLRQLQTAMTAANGKSATDLPRVTNEQAASILRSTMATAARHKLTAVTERWYEVALALAGWRQPGDRFEVAAEHRRAMFPDAELPVLWQLALGVAANAQQRGVAFVAPTVDPASDYTAVLKQAWAKMQRDARDTGAAAPTPALPPASTPAPAAAGNNNLLLGLAVLWGLSRRRKGRR